MDCCGRKMRWMVLAVIALSILISLFFLRNYRLDLIQTVVLNAVIQKAPPAHSSVEIREAFVRARDRAVQAEREDLYLELLFQISQRLEKVQRLTSSEVEKLLDQLERPLVREQSVLARERTGVC